MPRERGPNYGEIAQPYVDRAASFVGKPTEAQQHEVQIAQAYALLAIWAELKRYNDVATRPRMCMADVPESEWPDA